MGKILKVLGVFAAIVLAGIGVYCLTTKNSLDEDSAN